MTKTQAEILNTAKRTIPRYAVFIFSFLLLQTYSLDLRAEPDAKPILFLGNQDLPPVVYNRDGGPTGVAVDIVRALESKLCRPVVIICMDWMSAQDLVAQGEADALIQINETEERRMIYDFSDPLLQSEFSIFVHKDGPSVREVSDLRGMRVGVEAGGYPHKVLQKDPLIDLKFIPNFREGLEMLNRRALDAVVVDYRVGAYVIAKNGIKDIRISGNPIARNWSAIAVKKGNNELLYAINKALREIKTDGTYSRVIKEWDPKEVVFMTKEQVTRWAYLVVIGLLLICCVAAGAWIVNSRRAIKRSKQAEAQVEHLKNYLTNIIDSMPSMLVGMDNNRVITQWNKEAEKMTGIPALDAVGKPATELLPRFSSWISAMQGEMDEHHPASMEKLLIEKGGERRFYDLMLYPLTADGIEGVVLRIEDVTERARIQELMVQTEKMMSLGGLAAGMAHEINNPLGIIVQAAQNIERRVSPDLPANRKAAEESWVDLEGMKTYFARRQIPEFISSIREASLRASRIIANMLRFSRSTGTTMQPASLSEIIDQALELAANDYDLKKKYDFRSIEIVRDYEPHMTDIPMVSVEIEQVILNLLKNAAQAMIENPPEKKPAITLRLRQDRYALLEIEDNGPGMTEDIRRRVFEPFFTTKDPGIGTGLGLSVSYMIVTQNHKGLMEVESMPGRGTCFKVRLPVMKGEDR